MLGEAPEDVGSILSEDTPEATATEATHVDRPYAVHHVDGFPPEVVYDMACSWDELLGSLPSFHGVGCAEEQGKRSEMEDGTVVIRNFGGMPGAWLLAIYDGHGGRATVSLLLQRLHDNLLQQLQERAYSRWESLKKQAQCRRSELTDLLEQQQQRIRAQQRGRPQRRQQRLRVTTHGRTQFRPQAKHTVGAQESVDTEACKRNRAEAHSPQLEVEYICHRKQERIDAYWRLLRTHQLLRVLRWMEEGRADFRRDVRSDASSCLSPHYLLVCTEEDVRGALSDAFRETDEELLQEGIVQSGATACVALLRPYIDFQQLVNINPEEFTDRDWLLFSGNNVSFPPDGKRRGERDSIEYEGRRVCSPVVCFGSTLEPSGAEAAAASTAEGETAEAPLLEAKRKSMFTEEDAPPFSGQYYEVSTAPRGSVSPDVYPSAVSASPSVHHPVKSCRRAEERRAPSSLLSMKLSVAHLGDSRALLIGLDGTCERLTAATDHKASSFQEMVRVEQAGGWVFGERVNGMLAIGRAFGDWCLKLDPEQLKEFSDAAVKGTDTERTETCDERKKRGKTGTEKDVAGDCEDPLSEKTILRTMPEGLGGFPSKSTSPAAYALNGDEGGAVTNKEAGEAIEGGLALSQSRLDETRVHTGGRSLERSNFSPRKEALIVSNEPHICTKDLLPFQNSGSSRSGATVAISGSDDEAGREAPATVTSDTITDGHISGGSSVESGGLTSPPLLLLLGCDGLFDVCSDHAVTALALEFLRELQEAHSDLTPSSAAEAVARALIEEAITFRGSTDNVSVTVALLLPLNFCGGGGA